jgi:Spy/CpxP family protein refolding chaperone
MKRKIIAVSALLAVLLAGGYAVQAGPMGGSPMGGKGCRTHQQGEPAGHGAHTRMDVKACGGQLEKMTIVLGLSDSQRQEIAAILTAQQETDAPLMEKIAAGRQQLWEAARSSEMDEAKVTALADEQAKLMSEMMVSRIHVKNQIFALLTDEQLEKAEALGDGCGVGPGCGGPACGGPGCGTPDGAPQGGCKQRPVPGAAAGKAGK